MSVGITFEEMLAWNKQASDYWKAHLDANPESARICPAALAAQITCRILSATSGARSCAGPSASQRQPETPREKIPAGPLDALFDLHFQAAEIFRNLLAAA